MRDRIRGSVLPAAAILALALVSMPAAAGAKPKPKKPKLLVTSLTVNSSPAERTDPALPVVILESDLHGRFSIEYTIKNVGKRHSNTKHAGVYIGANYYGSQTVGPLNPGQAKTRRAKLDIVFDGPGWPFYAQVCITRNCSTDVAFSAVPRRWVVDKFATGPNTLAGGAPFFSSHTEGMVLDYHGMVVDAGAPYLLWLATGILRGEASGEADGCKYSGTGATAHSPWGWTTGPDWGYLEISPQLDSYFAEVAADDAGYAGSRSCENPDFSGEFTGTFWSLETLDSTQGRVYQPMFPAATELVGSYFVPIANAGRAVGEWSFRAALP